MKERIRCRDFGDGERIFVTDGDKIINRLMIILIILSFLALIIGTISIDMFVFVCGTIGILTIITVVVYLSLNREGEMK